ncbi:MAG: hypothetical protein ACK5JO_01575 [Halodesulfovibrio sp.]
MIATRLQQGGPYTSRATFMGKVLDTPHMHHDSHGELAIVMLHVQEHTACDLRTGDKAGAGGEMDRSPERRQAVPLLVRGQAARWCASHLDAGTMVVAEARLIPLGTTESGVCLTALETEHLQLVTEEAALPLPVQHGVPPASRGFRNPVYLSAVHSLRTN